MNADTSVVSETWLKRSNTWCANWDSAHYPSKQYCVTQIGLFDVVSACVVYFSEIMSSSVGTEDSNRESEGENSQLGQPK
jgi:hypothetical protein